MTNKFKTKGHMNMLKLRKEKSIRSKLSKNENKLLI